MNRVKVSPGMYSGALAEFMQDNPERAAFLTPGKVRGTPYYFPKYSGFALYEELGKGVTEIRGAFKTGVTPHFATEVVNWAFIMGADVVQLDCYAPVASAWANAGLLAYRIDPWNDAYAPEYWPGKLGTPSVLYMRKRK